MIDSKINFSRIEYASLNARQQESYNYQKASAFLADYGLLTLKLTDDWRGADFIAQHVGGEYFLKVQLKGRLVADTKYKGRDIWICFRFNGTWYLYPHDDFLNWALTNTTIGTTKGWLNGRYTWPSPTKKALEWLGVHALKS